MQAEDGDIAPHVDPELRRAGFTALYDAHVTDVYRYVHRRCHDTATAEDITQDVFLAAVRTVADPTDVSIGWLIRVARNRLLDLLRRDTSYRVKLRLVVSNPDAGDQIEVLADQLRVRQALATLDVSHRTVLTLRYIDGLTVASLANELGRTEKAVEGLVTRARRALRAALEVDDD